MTFPSRTLCLSALGVAAVLCALPAHAQQRPGDRAVPVSVKAPAPKRASTARIRKVAKLPLEALEARGSNPRGPFARLTEVQRDSLVENSRSLLGIRYKWAGATPERGVDCSGLVLYVFAKLGIELPHSSRELARLGTSVAKDTSEMQPGDLLVFSKLRSKRISHVGIYVGDGMMIHASSGSKQVVETPILEYRSALLRGVRRVISVDSAKGPGGEPDER
jgi:cell wall-associated NlpC family hydrolase